MVLLQWNMGVYEEGSDPTSDARKTELLSALTDTHRPDWIALQETPRALVAPLLLSKGYEVDAPRHRLLTGWRRSQWEATPIEPIAYRRASARVLKELTPTGEGRRVLLCNVHLPAGLYDRGANTHEALSNLTFEVQSFRISSQTGTSEVIVGDFNLEPFEQPLRKEGGLWGNRSLGFAVGKESERSRNGLGRERKRVLYNPSWRLFGADAEPYGTYYSTSGLGAPWYVFDQALFSADLILDSLHVNVITESRGTDLLSPRARKPNPSVGSDHLPVLWSIE